MARDANPIELKYVALGSGASFFFQAAFLLLLKSIHKSGLKNQNVFDIVLVSLTSTFDCVSCNSLAT